eukprot:TRINITY_DN56643_c0_g1_i1.p1 TRINITY_DN56643_c0_g1~~TRINITY_DN56643_c0_g1_i1.p1  ORF type:complete len:112 (-),score=8.83 TRINITY_DN56643_c0_g1_i1:19-333(-)
MAQCFISVYQVATDIGLAGIDIQAAEEVCRNKDGNYTYQACGVVVSDAILQFTQAASLLAIIPSVCGLKEYAHAWCTSDFFWLFSEVADLSTAAFAFPLDSRGR